MSKTSFKVEHLDNRELARHASVSTNSRHYCKECFCCACVDELRKRQAAKK